MKHALICLLIGLVSCAMSSVATASSVSGSVILNEGTLSATDTKSGIGGWNVSAGGTLKVTVQGLFWTQSPTSFTVMLDNVFTGTLTRTGSVPSNDIITAMFNLTAADMNAIKSDGSVVFKASTTASSFVAGQGDAFLVKYTFAAVPEPTSIAILGAGACGLVGFIRRRRK
ncbi:MAG: PEP-CTERM sorting domain-containing protein [Planctomycetota bacterium]|jgi:hypothetical protein